MKALIRGWRYAAVAALTIALPLAAACSAGEEAGTGEDEANEASLKIEFPEMYSAFDDGEHEFKLPAKIEGIDNARWSADPADAVNIAKQDDGSVMITVKKYYETVTINAKAGSLKASAKLHITDARENNLWLQGSERYNNGVVFKKPERGDGGRPDGGWGRGDGGGMGERFQNKELSCVNCHAKGGKGTDIEHTPTQTGGFSDEEIIEIMTKGKKPEGVEIRTPGMDEEKYAKIHTWKMEEEEKLGLVVYLRSLAPKSQGKYDFGGGIFGKGGKRGEGKRGDGERENKPAETNDTNPTN